MTRRIWSRVQNLCPLQIANSKAVEAILMEMHCPLETIMGNMLNLNYPVPERLLPECQSASKLQACWNTVAHRYGQDRTQQMLFKLPR